MGKFDSFEEDNEEERQRLLVSSERSLACIRAVDSMFSELRKLYPPDRFHQRSTHNQRVRIEELEHLLNRTAPEVAIGDVSMKDFLNILHQYRQAFIAILEIPNVNNPFSQNIQAPPAPDRP